MFLLPTFTTPQSAKAVQYDRETGLYYNRARTYNAELGRFQQRDPHQTALILMAVMLENAKTPMALARMNVGSQYADGMNLYQYAKSNPVNRRDPTGTTTTAELVVTAALAATLATIGLYATQSLIGQIAKLTGSIAGYQAITGVFVNSVDAGVEVGQDLYELTRRAAIDAVKTAATIFGAISLASGIISTEVLISQADAVDKARELVGPIVLHIGKIQTGGPGDWGTGPDKWKRDIAVWLNQIGGKLKNMKGKTLVKWVRYVGKMWKWLENTSGPPPMAPG